MTLIDIQNMDPCIFQDKKNPITGAQCRETFTNLKDTGYGKGVGEDEKHLRLTVTQSGNEKITSNRHRIRGHFFCQFRRFSLFNKLII